MTKALTWLGGMGLGAGLMCLFDPAAGDRRRAVLRERVLGKLGLGGAEAGNDGAPAGSLVNELTGLVREGRLQSRVQDLLTVLLLRARLLSASTHPGLIEVRIQDGRVVLSGAVLHRELEDVVSTVVSTPGVTEVTHQLEVVERAEDLPVSMPGLGLLPSAQTPEGRLLLLGLGGALLVFGAGGLFALLRKGLWGLLLIGMGARLLGVLQERGPEVAASPDALAPDKRQSERRT